MLFLLNWINLALLCFLDLELRHVCSCHRKRKNRRDVIVDDATMGQCESESTTIRLWTRSRFRLTGDQFDKPPSEV